MRGRQCQQFQIKFLGSLQDAVDGGTRNYPDDPMGGNNSAPSVIDGGAHSAAGPCSWGQWSVLIRIQHWHTLCLLMVLHRWECDGPLLLLFGVL